MNKSFIVIGWGILILLSLFILSSITQNSITGAATTDLPVKGEDSIISNIYSIFPHFQINQKTYFEEYQELQKITEQIMNECQDEDDKQQCILDNKHTFDVKNPDQTHKFTLLDDCESEEYQEFLEFYDYVDECYFAEKPNCICDHEFTEKYSIEHSKTKNKQVVITDVKNKFSIPYDLEAFDFLESDKMKEIGDDVFLHKDSSGNIIALEDLGTSNFCKIPSKRKFRFCVESQNKVQVKDEKNPSHIVDKNIVYKFAIEFEKSKPKFDPKRILEDYNIILGADCEMLEISREIEQKLQGTGAKIVQSTNDKICNHPPEFTDYFVGLRKNIYVALQTTRTTIDDSGESFEEIQKSVIEYPKGKEENKQLSESIYESTKSFGWFEEATKEAKENAFEKFIESTLYISEKENNLLKDNKNKKQRELLITEIAEGIMEFATETDNIQFNFINVQQPEEKEGVVDLKTLYEIARIEDINYKLLKSIIAVKSDFKNLKDDKENRQGIGMLRKENLDSIHQRITPTYPNIKQPTDEETINYIYNTIFLSQDNADVKIQVHALAIYLKWLKQKLEQEGKPATTRTILQAYQDNVENINQEGSSALIKEDKKRSVEFYSLIAAKYREFDFEG